MGYFIAANNQVGTCRLKTNQSTNLPCYNKYEK